MTVRSKIVILITAGMIVIGAIVTTISFFHQPSRSRSILHEVWPIWPRTRSTEDMVHIKTKECQSEIISKLQNGLILVLACMVESRGKCTGDHVRKTTAYTDVILRELKTVLQRVNDVSAKEHP